VIIVIEVRNGSFFSSIYFYQYSSPETQPRPREEEFTYCAKYITLSVYIDNVTYFVVVSVEFFRGNSETGVIGWVRAVTVYKDIVKYSSPATPLNNATVEYQVNIF
jgi:hypothetical protein